MSSNVGNANAPDFYGPRLKVERAEHHINKLESIFENYVRDNMKRLRARGKRGRLKPGQTGGTATFPKHTATVLGDAIHNLRASLDHAYYIACLANAAQLGDFTKFPFGKDRQSLEGSINGHKLKGIAPSDEVIAVILGKIQPYESGSLGLYGLHRLDITDKHMVLIPTQHIMRIDRLDITDATGAKTGGGIRGITIVHQGRHGGFIEVDGGGAILQGSPKDVFDITFQEGQPFEGQSILKTARSLQQATVEALSLVEGAI